MTEVTAIKHNVSLYYQEALKITGDNPPSPEMQGYAEKVQALSQENPEAVRVFCETYPHLVKAYESAMAFPNFEYPVILPIPTED